MVIPDLIPAVTTVTKCFNSSCMQAEPTLTYDVRHTCVHSSTYLSDGSGTPRLPHDPESQAVGLPITRMHLPHPCIRPWPSALDQTGVHYSGIQPSTSGMSACALGSIAAVREPRRQNER
jgi:hypothetical protein